jgi:transposase
MRQLARVTMSMRELDRLKCIQAIVDGDLRSVRAAERLGLTTRQIRRLTNRYRAEGPVGLIPRSHNRPSNHRLDPSLEAQVAGILREHYPDFGPTLACEKLATRHGIVLAKETVRRLQMAAGLWLPRKLRPPKVQQPRTRRACLGELVQIDGCEHRWFEERAPSCTALVYVDDATSRLMVVHFTQTESTFGYFEATRDYLASFGKPLAFYMRQSQCLSREQARCAGGTRLHAVRPSAV